MKTLKSVIALCALAFVFASCQKSADQIFAKEQSLNEEIATCHAGNPPVPPMLMCAPKIVPLCVPQGSIGTITVSTGMDNKVYVTYTTNTNWFMRECHLYVGDAASLPLTAAGSPIPELFNYHKYYNNYAPVQSYTFVLPGMPSTMVMSAQAKVVNVTSGQVMAIDAAWGDACGSNTGTFTIQ